VRLEISSAREEPLQEIASQAARIADQVQRLRYLRQRVVLAPIKARWRTWLTLPGAIAIGAAVILIGIAASVWILT